MIKLTHDNKKFFIDDLDDAYHYLDAIGENRLVDFIKAEIEKTERRYKQKLEYIETFFPGAEKPTYPVDCMRVAEIWEIGSDLPCINKLLDKYHKPFKYKSLLDAFYEYDFVVLDKPGLEMIIECYRDETANYYKKLFNDGDLNINETKLFLEERINTWDNPVVPDLKPYGLEDNLPMVRAWDWEYQIWKLVEIYKNFDWDKSDLVLTGW